MRDIFDIIGKLREIMPVDMTEIHASLNSVEQSAGFSPPELMYLRWRSLTEPFEWHFKFPDTPIKHAWEIKAISILLEMTEEQVKSRFPVDEESLDQEVTQQPLIPAGPIWYDLNDVLAIVNESTKTTTEGDKGGWAWYRNTRCKYIGLRIDMRDGKCLIKDKDGNPITLEQLKYQYGQS